MNRRWRILMVVTRSPARGTRFASSEAFGLPPRDAVLMAAQLMQLGAELRVLDQETERLSDRVARREARLWRADIVLLYAGGSLVADDPVPDSGPLRQLLFGWSARAPVLVVGPLARHYAEDLLDELPRLAGALRSGVHASLVGQYEPDLVPGLVFRRGASLIAAAPPPDPERDRLPAVLPAWHALPMDACGARAPGGLRVADVLDTAGDVDGTLAQVRHAVRRAGARRIVFTDRDFAADGEFVRELSRGMFAAAPGVPWTCRVLADRLDPMVALSLANGGCVEVLVTAPADRHAPGLLPMDDPSRPRIESAVDACRVTGMPVVVEHVIGRPGHNRDTLAAWQRWFADRRMLVHAHVRLVHGGQRGPRLPTLREAAERAGCWDNDLRPRDIERAVRGVSEHGRLAALLGRRVTDATAGWTVRQAGPEDEAAQAAIFNTCFRKDKDAATFAWKYRGNPDGPAIGRLACDGQGRVVGSYSYVPRRFLRDGRPVTLMQASDAMTLPEWQGRGIFTGLDDLVAEAAGAAGFPLVFAYSGRISLKGFLGNGWRLIGHAPLWRRSFRSRRALLRRGRLGPLLLPAAPLLDVVLRMADRRRLPLPAGEASLVRLPRFDESVDRLFAARAPRTGLVGVRSAAWLNWRYVDNPTRRQECYGLRRGGELLGYIVVELQQGNAFLADHLAADEASRAALLLAFTALARARGMEEASALLFDHHPSVPVLGALGYRRGRTDREFRDIFPFIVRLCRPDAPESDLQMTRWHLADGDRDAEHLSA